MLVLSIPAVQTGLGNYATEKLNEEFKTNISIEKLGLQFNGDVELKNIYIEDFKKNTLISIEELNTSILSFSNLYQGNLIFGDVDIMGLVFNIKTYKDFNDTNLDVFVAKLEGDNPKKGDGSFLLSSSDVSIYDSVFILSDENKETSEILQFSDLNINATNFLIKGSDVSARINTLSLKDSRGLSVKNMMTNFKYTRTDMTFGSLQINTEESVVKGDLKFLYKREDLQFFTDKVLVEASFKESNILLNELNVFYNEFGSYQRARFSVNISGTLNDLQTKKLVLNTSAQTKIYGDIQFKNLFNKEPGNFSMRGKFRNLTSTYKDLKALLPNVLGASIPSTFDRLGKFKIKGDSYVTASMVDTKMTIETDLGFIDSNLHITKINDIDNAAYNGNLKLNAFDLGTFLNDPKVGKTSLDIDVNGLGFVAETINTQVSGLIDEIVYNNYNYRKTKISGNVKNKIFDGILLINDKNLKLNFNGLLDYSEAMNKYDFEAKVDYANLNALNFVKRDSISIFRSTVNMNMNSSNWDDAYGKITFRNTSYKNEIDTYNFTKFKVGSRFEGVTRFIDIDSPDIMEGTLSGEFVIKDLIKLFKNSIGSIYTNYTPYEVAKDQQANFNFRIYNKIVEVFYPDIELGKNTFVRGKIESDAERFKFTFKSPKIRLLDNFAKRIELQVDNSNPVFNTYVEIDSINTKYYNASKLNLINVTVNDTLFMRSEFSGGKHNNDKFNLSFYHTVNEDNHSVIGFKKSDVTVKDYKWYINENGNHFNKISFTKDLKTFNINKLKINHNDSEVNLSGFIKNSNQKDLKLNFRNVDLSKITPDIDSLSLAGNVNGKLDILQKEGSYLPNSTVKIDNFKINDFDLGDFNAKITGNEDLTNYSVDVSIKDDLKKSFKVLGDINVKGEHSYINVNLNLNQFKLAPLNPLLSGVLSNVRGDVTGKAKIAGKLNHPNIEGELYLDKSGFTIPYLNVDYQFNDKTLVNLEKQSFVFNNCRLIDTKHYTNGKLNGRLNHVNLSDWSLDLNLDTQRLLVLDTKQTEESLYYGTGFIGGIASIKGPADELTIEVIGETKKGTVFKIPLSDTESFGDNSFIHFITPEQKLAKEKGEAFVFEEIKGLELDFDLDVTQDAELEIIIDKNTGHALKGKGVGNLLVEINTNGKFDMWGDFSVFEGVYNFAYGGLIQKEFIVQPGGTIAWEGDPLKAQINMLAIYKTDANPSPLLDNPINRSIPVELNIALTGDLERPNPIYKFEFPNVNSTVKSELQYRLESTDDRQNQALYLISTGSFSRGLNDLNFSGTIAERLNGIINDIFTNNNGKIDVGLNFEAGENRPDYRTDDRFGLTLKTKLSERILFNGKVGVPVGGAGANETVVAGDLEIDFLLNEEGTLVAKVFNRENSIRNFGEGVGYTQGGGISYNVDFDTFKELINSLFKKKDKSEKTSEPEIKEEAIENPFPGFISIKSEKKE